MDFQPLIDLLLTPLMWILDGFVYVIGFTLYYVMDGFLLFVYVFLAGLDLSAIAFDFIGQAAGFPSQLLFLLDAIAFPQALTIISGAYLVRFLLNLIPGIFTRV